MNDLELYRRMFELAGDAFFLHDYQGRIRMVNETACRMLGYRREELQEMSVLEIDADHARERLEKYLRTLDEEGDLRFETEHLAKSGKTLPVEVHSTQITYHGEHLVLSMARDIEERKLAESSMRLLSRTGVEFLTAAGEEQLYQRAVDLLAGELPEALVCFVLYEPEQDLLRFETASGFGREGRSYLGKFGVVPETMQYHPEEREREQLRAGEVHGFDPEECFREKLGFSGQLLRRLAGFLRGRQSLRIGVVRGEELYGSLLIAFRGRCQDWRIHFIEAFAYQAAAAVEYQRLMGQLRRERRRAEEAYAHKSSFFAGVSHELRTPLNAVLGYADILSRELAGFEALDYVHSIQDSGRELLELVDDILDLSKIEAGELEMQPEPLNLYGLMEEVYRLFEESAESKGLRLSFILSPGLAGGVKLDHTRLRQVMINLVSNAVKYTESGKVELRLSGEVGEDAAEVDLHMAVRDTGRGISRDLLPVIFEPYSQERDGGQKMGVGLGLAITKRLVEMMGGRIEVDSSPGRGSTFSVSLYRVPLAAAGEEGELSRSGFVWNSSGTGEERETGERLGASPKVPSPADEPAAVAESSSHPAAEERCGQGQDRLLARWRQVRESGSFGEIAEFAREVEQAGERCGSEALTAYGRQLGSLAEQFDVVRLREKLAEFASLLADGDRGDEEQKEKR